MMIMSILHKINTLSWISVVPSLTETLVHKYPVINRDPIKQFNPTETTVHKYPVINRDPIKQFNPTETTVHKYPVINRDPIKQFIPTICACPKLEHVFSMSYVNGFFV